MDVPYYHVDAFTSKPFSGNPAGVCLLDDWLPEKTMQSIAFENNLSETAFVLNRPSSFAIRWFTPTTEVDLCGHATLAAAHVLFNQIGLTEEEISFASPSGPLTVTHTDDMVTLDFPSRPPQPCDIPADLVKAIGIEPIEVLRSRDFLVVLSSQDLVESASPDMQLLASVDALGTAITAPGKDCDFVSRFFAPRAGIPEDPVTGSSHCTLIPYWSAKLGRKELSARQLSPRGGELFCQDLGERVAISGRAATYSIATIKL